MLLTQLNPGSEFRELTILRMENKVQVKNLLAICLKADYYICLVEPECKSDNITRLGQHSLLTSDIKLHHTVIDIY